MVGSAHESSRPGGKPAFEDLRKQFIDLAHRHADSPPPKDAADPDPGIGQGPPVPAIDPRNDREHQE